MLSDLEGIIVLLSSIISSSAVSSAVSSSAVSSAVSSSAISSSAITMITAPGLPQYGVAMVSALIVILSLKEILSSSQKWNEYLNNSFNLVAVPFIFTFLMILLFNVEKIIG
jgi:hypothetical protein